MSVKTIPVPSPPTVLDHDLNKYFPELLKFDSTVAMEASDFYKGIKPEAERILNSIIVEHIPRSIGADNGSQTSVSSTSIGVAAWNLERGTRFEGIVDAFSHNEALRDRDVLLLSELDYGMARSGNRFVAKELAERLQMNYAFAPVYIPLQKGSGVESEIEGENAQSIHGLALFSRYPITNVHAVPLPNGKDKMWGKEKRLGRLRALIVDIEHPGGTFRAVTVHLDAHCSRAHRRRQIQIVLDHLDTLPPLPTILGGDWNTTGFNSQNSTRAIMSYWRRVFMGPKNVAINHLPYPERFFERRLFGDLESRGYENKNLNELGVGTLHYDVASIEKYTNLRDLLPEWCFPFIFWAAGRVGGRVSGRLDWFAARGFSLASDSAPKTIGELIDTEGIPLSDHDAITVDLVFR